MKTSDTIEDAAMFHLDRRRSYYIKKVKSLRAELADAYEDCRRMEDRLVRLVGIATNLTAARKTLELIRDRGGKTTDEGLSCDGAWCAEQARQCLENIWPENPSKK